MATTIIDAAALREHLGPNGPWAVEAGTKVSKLLERLNKDFRWLAGAVGTSEQTIRLVLTGALVPRDYLRSAIAFALGTESDIIWPPLSRTRVGEIGLVA